MRLRGALAAAGDDAGPETIRWHLERHFGVTVSAVRFAAAMPNETWQADFTHYRLADDTDVEPVLAR